MNDFTIILLTIWLSMFYLLFNFKLDKIADSLHTIAWIMRKEWEDK